MNNDNQAVKFTLSIDELERLIYRKCRETNSQLYKGIEPYFALQHENIEKILLELEQIKLRLDEKPAKKNKKVTQDMINQMVKSDKEEK
ncbi:MAG: hypothetical protein LPK26_04805 [Bacillaceae bacterium]|nr:hypothetical protein [Bacillaceae bacterium]